MTRSRLFNAMLTLGLTLGLTLIALPLAVAGEAAAATTVTFPAGPWAGVLQVQVTSSASFVGYSLSSLQQQRSQDEVVPNPSPGSPFTLNVPTWGLGEDDPVTGFLQVFECTGADLESCSFVVQEIEDVHQTEPVDITLETPASPVFIPEQHIFVTADGGAGGEIRLIGPSGTEQVLSDGVREEVDMTNLLDADVLTWPILRCSPVAPRNCGRRPEANQPPPVTAVRRLSLSASTADTFVNPDEASPDASTALDVSIANVPQTLTWALLNSHGHVVSGPVEFEIPLDGSRLMINPATHAGQPLVLGPHTLRVRTTLSGAGGTRTTTVNTPLQVSDRPPLDTVALASNSGVVRPGSEQVVFKLAQTHAEYQDHAIVVVRNRLGQRVWRRTSSSQASCGDTDGICYNEFQLGWDGRSNGGVLQPPNTYRAYGYLVDKWGRTLKRNLGPVVIERLVTRTMTTPRVHPFTDQMHATLFDSIGRCSRLRVGPGFWLESMVLDCPSPAQPGDDRVWLGIRGAISNDKLTITDRNNFSRLVKVRLHVYGHADSPGSTLRTSVSNSLEWTDNIFVALPGVLPGAPGWHLTGWHTADPVGLGRVTRPAFRLQVSGGSRYFMSFMKADYVYRAWTNP